MVPLRLLEPLLMSVLSLKLNLLYGSLCLYLSNLRSALCSSNLSFCFELHRCRLHLCALHLRLRCSSNFGNPLVALLNDSVQALLGLTLNNLDRGGRVGSHFCVLPKSFFSRHTMVVVLNGRRGRARSCTA